MINRLFAWIQKNVLLAVLAGIVLLTVLFPRQLRRIVGSPVRRRKRRVARRRASPVRRRTSVRRSPVRSVGGKGYPAAGGGFVPYKYNKDGTIKKAWQVGGTVAARNRMSKLRRAK